VAAGGGEQEQNVKNQYLTAPPPAAPSELDDSTSRFCTQSVRRRLEARRIGQDA
jgi:hypothetical protein